MLASPVGTETRGSLVRRFSGPERRPEFWIALWALTVAAEIVVVYALVTADAPVPGYRAIFRLVGGVFAACGLVAWRRRPDSYSGPLMVAVGFGLLVEPVAAQFDAPPIRFVGDLLEDAWSIPLVALLLTFHTGGRLTGTADRVLLGSVVLALILEVIRHLFLVRDGNVLRLYSSDVTALALLVGELTLNVLACVGLAVVIAGRWRRATPPSRRAMLPSVFGIVTVLLFGVSQGSGAVAWFAVCSLLLVPAGFLAALLRSRLARGGVADLFGEIRTMRGSQLQERLAKATGDPSLVVAYRQPGSDAYADADGDPVALPPGSGRAFKTLDHGALVYDTALDEDPGLVEVVAAAASIALEHDQLQAESRASRQRLVAAGDSERRRLERDLHDGAQQRLVMVAIQLRLIQSDIRRDPAAAEKLVTAASGEVARSLDELRELARGIHPAVLEHGIGPALNSLAARSAVPTAVSCDALGEVPRPLELALYFVACEALANIGKYAGASTASIQLARSDGAVVIEIADNGVGGARATGGSGLQGLQDRVEALGGHLLVTSPPGAGTVVSAELPCGS
jgi:signal transduction histidine kinase